MQEFIQKNFPTVIKARDRVYEKLNWQNLTPNQKTLYKILPIVVIAVAIPLTVGLALQQQHFQQFANPRCDPTIPGLAKNCITTIPTPTLIPSPILQVTDTPTPTTTLTITPTPTSTLLPSLTPPTPTPTPTGYTFYDDFTGTTVNSIWHHDFHCCGTIAGYDPTLTTVSNGILDMRVVNRSGGWYTDLIDTKTTFTQKYGFFQARIKIPKGKGLWPAFWGYYSGNPEIDTIEICANPIGTNGGNDASLLHTTVHYSGSTGANASTGYGYRTSDLSTAYHIYAVDWRADHINFYLDGAPVWSYTNTANIPNIALPVILNLGVGGTWCSNPDSTTPSPSDMYVDWVRVSQ